ncbi:TonB-dependent siderophore receptor [Aliarcobacter vitoriensis]|uniref:TonB-dependent siderophore receptor n=1 Tax=Aliarcobacter vitoriensis TaxID=2011099 RepID=UPI003AADC822
MNTATKLDLSIRETPQSVKVITQEYLEDTNITSFQEMLSNVTGVSAIRTDERLSPFSRGFGVDYYQIDGIPTASLNQFASAHDQDLSIYDRVEIVKGANGLMTGAGNPGASINMIRKHANSKVFKGDINLSAGSWDNYRGTVDIQSPLNEDKSLRLRIVGGYEDKGSFIDRYSTQTKVLYGILDYDLTDNTTLSAGIDYQEKNRDGAKWAGLPAFYSDGTRTNFSRNQAISDDWNYWDSESKMMFTNLKHYFDNDISIHANYSYMETRENISSLGYWGNLNKNTGSGMTWMNWNADRKYKEHNFDTYVSVPFSLGNLEHEIIGGFTYNQVKPSHYKEKLTSSPLTNFYNLSVPNPNLTKVDVLTANKTIQTGTYFAGKFSLMEDLKLIAGLRVSNWEYKSENGSGNREFKNELTPYAGLIYDIDENHSIYASYTDIFKPQESKDKNNNYLDPIVGKNYETGIKGEYFDKRLNTGLSIFRVEQDGVATKDEGVFITGTTQQAYKAAKGVVSKGVEFDISGEITDNWNLSFGIANFEAKDANDKKFNTTSSRTTANLFTKYKINKDFAIGGGLNYKSKFYTGSGATKITQDAHILANVMASYDVTKNLKLQLNINNLFDKKYYEGIGNFNMNYGEPRSFALNMRYSF